LGDAFPETLLGLCGGNGWHFSFGESLAGMGNSGWLYVAVGYC